MDLERRDTLWLITMKNAGMQYVVYEYSQQLMYDIPRPALEAGYAAAQAIAQVVWLRLASYSITSVERAFTVFFHTRTHTGHFRLPSLLIKC